MKQIFGVLFAVLLLTGCGCEQIDGGNVGVQKDMGRIKNDLLGEGFHWISLFTKVVEVSTKTTTKETEAACVSKDLQEVHAKISVQYAPLSEKVVCLVQKFGSEDGAWSFGVLEPAIQEVTKAVSAKYTAEELVTRRAEVKVHIEEGLNEFVAKTLDSRGCNAGIHISNVAVINFAFSKEFNASIEAKVKAEQDALRAENEKKQRVTQAEAKAAETKLNADAEAYKTEVESKTRAAAIERESKALESSPDLIQLRIAERWNGVLPTYTGNSIPMLQLERGK